MAGLLTELWPVSRTAAKSGGPCHIRPTAGLPLRPETFGHALSLGQEIGHNTTQARFVPASHATFISS